MVNKIKSKDNDYQGWELNYFDNAKKFRLYQLDLIKEFLQGSIAEVGPGNGKNLSQYINIPTKVSLFEPSKKLYQNLRKNFKKNKKISFNNKNFKTNLKKYDAILYLDVLEHIKNDKFEIKHAFKCLKRGGFLIINVPAFQYLYSEFDRDVGHFRRYSKKSILKLFSNLKFKLIKLSYYDVVGYFLSLLSKLLINNYKKDFEKKIKFWNSLIWLSIILDKLIFYTLGKSLLLVIKKN